MIVELTTALFFALAAIGGILALKWKNGNVKPTDKELNQHKGLE